MPSSKPSLLLVDDEPEILEFLTRALRKHFEITSTASPFEALDKLTHSRFDVVISDNKMPQMSGLALLAQISRAQPAIKRVLLTGYSDDAAIALALEQTIVQVHLEKPIDSHTLLRALQEVLSSQETRPQGKR